MILKEVKPGLSGNLTPKTLGIQSATPHKQPLGFEWKGKKGQAGAFLTIHNSSQVYRFFAKGFEVMFFRQGSICERFVLSVDF